MLSRFINLFAKSVNLVELFSKEDINLAQQSVIIYPGNPNPWFWMARIQEKTSLSVAIQSYQKGLSFDPGNGLSWCSLAALNEREGKIQQAFEILCAMLSKQ